MEVFLPPGIAAPAERGAGRGNGYGPCGPGDSPEAREFPPLKLMFADSRGSGSTLSSVFGVACINRRGHALPRAMHYAFYETKKRRPVGRPHILPVCQTSYRLPASPEPPAPLEPAAPPMTLAVIIIS